MSFTANTTLARWLAWTGRLTFLASATLSPGLAADAPSAEASHAIGLTEDARDESAGGLACYRIATPTATYFLEKSGAGLSSLVDREGRDWLGFEPTPGSRSAGEFRGFPNAVNRPAAGYFHPKNTGTGASSTKVEHVAPERVSISAVSADGQWACRYDFLPAYCTFTMTRTPPGANFWVLYEGTPGGGFDATDWWMTSAVATPQAMSVNHDGDIPAPEWIVFGDTQSPRVLFLLHHEDDGHPDGFYAMRNQMTVFGFGRQRARGFLDRAPQSVTIGFLETTRHAAISRALAGVARAISAAAPR